MPSPGLERGRQPRGFRCFLAEMSLCRLLGSFVRKGSEFLGWPANGRRIREFLGAARTMESLACSSNGWINHRVYMLRGTPARSDPCNGMEAFC